MDEARPDERALVEALRRGDEAAFREVVERHHPMLVRLATVYVRDRAVAEEVAQGTWVAVLTGLSRFEGRSSLKTWIARILINQAKTRGVREGRTVSFSALEGADDGSVESGRFLPAGHHWAGHWAAPPRPWETSPEDRLLGGEMRAVIQRVVDALPGNQRLVITMRDIEGWETAEVCNVLEITETNQRVLLHRARSRVRRALEEYLTED